MVARNMVDDGENERKAKHKSPYFQVSDDHLSVCYT